MNNKDRKCRECRFWTEQECYIDTIAVSQRGDAPICSRAKIVHEKLEKEEK